MKTTRCLFCGEDALEDGTGEWDWECGFCGFLWNGERLGGNWSGLRYWSRFSRRVVEVPEGCMFVTGKEALNGEWMLEGWSGVKIPVARCNGCGRVFQLTSRGCPDCNKGKVPGGSFWDWKHEGWVRDGVMLVWGDRLSSKARCPRCGAYGVKEWNERDCDCTGCGFGWLREGQGELMGYEVFGEPPGWTTVPEGCLAVWD